MVHLNMTYLHCLQHSLFEHLFNLYYWLAVHGNQYCFGKIFPVWNVPTFYFMHANCPNGDGNQFRAIPILLRKLPNICLTVMAELFRLWLWSSQHGKPFLLKGNFILICICIWWKLNVSLLSYKAGSWIAQIDKHNLFVLLEGVHSVIRPVQFYQTWRSGLGESIVCNLYNYMYRWPIHITWVESLLIMLYYTQHSYWVCGISEEDFDNCNVKPLDLPM